MSNVFAVRACAITSAALRTSANKNTIGARIRFSPCNTKFLSRVSFCPRSFERRGRGSCEKIGIKRYSPPCITAASLQGGVAERFRKYREASAYREAGVVFRRIQKENHPGCVCFGGFVKFSLMTQPPLLAVVQRWCKEGNNALSQLIHSFGVVRSREIVLEFERAPRHSISKFSLRRFRDAMQICVGGGVRDVNDCGRAWV